MANRKKDEGTFVVDGAYLRQQTKDAVKTFIAPLTGVLAASHDYKIQFNRGRITLSDAGCERR